MGNTYQTYIWVESDKEVKYKVDLRNEIINQKYEKVLKDSKDTSGPKY